MNQGFVARALRQLRHLWPTRALRHLRQLRGARAVALVAVVLLAVAGCGFVGGGQKSPAGNVRHSVRQKSPAG